MFCEIQDPFRERQLKVFENDESIQPDSLDQMLERYNQQTGSLQWL